MAKKDTPKICRFLFALLVVVVMIDPTNTILGVKELVFICFILSCVIYHVKVLAPMWGIIGLFFLISILSLFFGLCQQSEFKMAFTIGYFKMLLFLFVLLFVQKFDFLDKITTGAILISIITIIIAIIFTYHMSFEPKIYEYISSRENFIMISRRVFLGYELVRFFYKTSPILIIPLAFSLYRVLNSQQSGRNFFLAILFFVTLILSGTRANMFSAVLVTLLMIIYRMNRSKLWHIVVPFLSICFLFFAVIMTKNLLEDQEISVFIKSEHQNSIIQLLEDHPLFLLLGQGPGSLYYTTGAGTYVPQSELSYMEIIRMFGLFMGGVIIFLWFLPLIIAYKRKNMLPEFFPFFISYLAYLFIGGTNPLLFSSTGMIVLACAYSFALKDQHENINYHSSSTKELVVTH
ncbi:MAG: hypothetical protein LBS05_04930 [Tannerellaceae bacterium]|nr:hypothetical protein [Tannerellaceae bacterium]